MHEAVLDYVESFSTPDPIDVLDIGGRNLNGTPRQMYPAACYTVLDLRPASDVDIVADAAAWDPDGQRWDMVLCTEVFEHARDWPDILATCQRALRPGGRLIATCASGWRPPHSGVEAAPIQAGEYYANVQPGEMLEVLQEQGWEAIDIHTARDGLDLQITAIAPASRPGEPAAALSFAEV